MNSIWKAIKFNSCQIYVIYLTKKCNIWFLFEYRKLWNTLIKKIQKKKILILLIDNGDNWKYKGKLIERYLWTIGETIYRKLSFKANVSSPSPYVYIYLSLYGNVIMHLYTREYLICFANAPFETLK